MCCVCVCSNPGSVNVYCLWWQLKSTKWENSSPRPVSHPSVSNGSEHLRENAQQVTWLVFGGHWLVFWSTMFDQKKHVSQNDKINICKNKQKQMRHSHIRNPSQDWNLRSKLEGSSRIEIQEICKVDVPPPEVADLGETLEDIMESSLLSRTAWTKLFDEDGGRSVLEIFLRQLDDEQEDWMTELIESTTHQLLQVAFAFLAGALSMCVLGTVGAVSTRPEPKL